MAKIPDDMERRLKMVEEASKSLAAYNDLLKSTNELQANIEHVERQRLKLQKEISDAQYKVNNNAKLKLGLTKAEVDELNLKIEALEYSLTIEEETLKLGKHELRIRQQAVDEVNKLNVVLNSTLNITKQLGKHALRQGKQFLEQQKAVKETELSMGILSNQANGFRNNIYRASISTNQIGVDTKLLSKIQGTYADNIGRAVQLNEQELEAMSQLAKGTMLGAEGAAEFAAQMENFNISAEGSVDYIQEVVNLSHEMGLSTGKVIKNLQKNMGLLNRFNFKGGVKGLGKMAAMATKFKFEMEDIAGFAETLMTPEGAVEVASKLQVLGGEWAKLGDPFELMYRSRNDIEGLTKDIINATKATARFDKTSGEVTIDPMEMQRLREVANATGMSFENLSRTAKEAAKFTQIQTGMSNIFNQEDKDFLASMAKFNKKTGEFEITTQVGDETVTESVKSLRQITPAIVESQRQLKQTLEQNAKQAITFDESIENIKNTFKSVLFPGFEAFATALQTSVGDFHEWAVKSGALDDLADIGKYMGELAGGLIKFMAKNPIASALTLGAGYLVGKAAMWIANGRLLGMGFNSVAGGGGGKMNKSGIGGGISDIGKSLGKKGKRAGRGKYLGRGLGKMGKGLGKGMGALGGISAGFDAYQNFTDDDLTGWEAFLKTLDENKFLAIGAALAPFTGGASLMLGAADVVSPTIGNWDKNNGTSSNNNSGITHQDFIARPGENPISFSSSDSLIGAKKGGPIDKMIDQNTSGGASGKVSVEFNKPIKIEGNLEVTSGDNSKEIDLNDPILMQNLSKMIMEEISKAVSGGKLSSNPSPA